MSAATHRDDQPEPLPLYHRVYLLLRQQIQDGSWPEAVAMPGEHELATTHRVSRITVRRALDRLEREGLVSRRRGAGTYAHLSREPAKQRENLRGLIENLLAMGLRTSVDLIDFSYVPAPPDIAAMLAVPTGSVVQRSVRVRSAGGVPFSHLTAWVPEAIGRQYQRTDLQARPLLQLLESAGAPAVRAEQVISARLADSGVAPLLQVEPGSALLWVRRQVWDARNVVVEVIEALYRPDQYEYQIGLNRMGGVWSTAD